MIIWAGFELPTVKAGQGEQNHSSTYGDFDHSYRSFLGVTDKVWYRALAKDFSVLLNGLKLHSGILESSHTPWHNFSGV